MNPSPLQNMEGDVVVPEIRGEMITGQFVGECADLFIAADRTDTIVFETARRNFFVGLLLHAKETCDPKEDQAEALNRLATEQLRVAAEAHNIPAPIVSHDTRFWRSRETRLYAAFESPPQTPLPTSLELIESLRSGDQKYRHNLKRPVF